MLVYRSAQRIEDTATKLIRLLRSADELTHSVSPSHDDVQALLIELGEFEAGVADAICARADTVTPELDALRRASVCAGHLLRESWAGGEKLPVVCELASDRTRPTLRQGITARDSDFRSRRLCVVCAVSRDVPPRSREILPGSHSRPRGRDRHSWDRDGPEWGRCRCRGEQGMERSRIHCTAGRSPFRSHGVRRAGTLARVARAARRDVPHRR